METPTPSDRLDSWKEIAAYLGRTEKTARRWEQHEGLPVHRLQHAERGSVYAFRYELDAWRTARTAEPRNGELPKVEIPASVLEARRDGIPGSRAARLSRRVALGVAGLAAVVVVAALLGRARPMPSSPPTLAVLPFEGTTDDSGADLGAALASAIVDHLSAVQELRVRPFASAVRQVRPGEEPAVTGRRMVVDAIATGQVREAGGHVSIAVSLIDTTANTQLWGHAYELDSRELGLVPARIAEALRDRTVRAFGGSPRGALANQLSRHPDAARAFLRGRGFPRNPGRRQIETSIGYLEEAVRLDPSFVAALGGLATAHFALSLFVDRPTADTVERANDYAARTLALDPANSGAHQTLAFVSHAYDFNHAEAERLFRAAMTAAPGSAGVRSWYADFLISLRRFDEASAANRESGLLDPGWLEVDTVAGNILLFQHRPAEARVLYRRALDVDPNHGLSRYFLAEALLAEGDSHAALSEVRAAATAMGSPPFLQATLVRALARSGDLAAAHTEIETMLRARTERYYPAFAIAEAFAGLGREAEALDWLERAVDERLLGYYLPSVTPAYDVLRQTPRFSKVLARLGLPGS